MSFSWRDLTLQWHYPLMRFAVFIILALLATEAPAEITGKPRVIDGDQIEIAGQRLHLHGIDAPEAAQRCFANNRQWPCGRNATLALAGMIGTNWVSCEERGNDTGGRHAAVCRIAGAQGPDVAAMMVAAGWALAYRQVSTDYVKDELFAKRARRGVWRGDFIRPWEWRRGIRLASRGTRPGACLIKGDIARRGTRIYHVPEGKLYARIKIDPNSGERWFCSETEARAAGWTRSRR